MNFGLHVLNRVGILNFQGNYFAGQGPYEDIHFTWLAGSHACQVDVVLIWDVIAGKYPVRQGGKYLFICMILREYGSSGEDVLVNDDRIPSFQYGPVIK